VHRHCGKRSRGPRCAGTRIAQGFRGSTCAPPRLPQAPESTGDAVNSRRRRLSARSSARAERCSAARAERCSAAQAERCSAPNADRRSALNADRPRSLPATPRIADTRSRPCCRSSPAGGSRSDLHHTVRSAPRRSSSRHAEPADGQLVPHRAGRWLLAHIPYGSYPMRKAFPGRASPIQDRRVPCARRPVTDRRERRWRRPAQPCLNADQQKIW
jgi:hypothetical protein